MFLYCHLDMLEIEQHHRIQLYRTQEASSGAKGQRAYLVKEEETISLPPT